MQTFFFKRASSIPFEFLRLGVALSILFQWLPQASNCIAMFGEWGLTQRSALEALAPPVPWTCFSMAEALGLPTNTVLVGTHTVLITAAVALLLRLRPAISATVCAVAHGVLMMQCFPAYYGVTGFTQMALFYLVVGYAWSAFDQRALLRGATGGRLAIRLLQIHLCIVYTSSGIYKGMGAQWWNGEAIWRASNLDSMNNFPNTWLASVPWLAVVLGVGTVVLEVGYGFAVWFRRWRTPWVLGMISMHIGIGTVLGLYSFALHMIVLNAAAFLLDLEPRTRRRIAVRYDRACAICSKLVTLACSLRPLAFQRRNLDTPASCTLGESSQPAQMEVTWEGVCYQGAEAFLALWCAALGLSFGHQLGQLQIARRAYQAFARNRYRFGCRISS